MKRLLRVTLLGAVLALAGTAGSAAQASQPTGDALLETASCPAGYTGIIVTVDGHTVMACQNVGAVGVTPCPSGYVGEQVWVNGKSVFLCFNIRS